MGKDRDTAGTKMFKMKIGEGIWAKGRGILKGSNGKGNRLGGERRERWVERAFVDGAEDATGERGLAMGSRGGILFIEAAGDGGFFSKDFWAGRRWESYGELGGI